MALMQGDFNGEVINIGSGTPVTIRKVTETVKVLIGQGDPFFGQIPYRTEENMALYADISKANNVLNWRPEISLEDGLLRTINFYMTANT